MNTANDHIYSFGPFQLNVRERLLRRDGIPVQLPPKAFDILVMLVANSGRLVTKDELMSAVWQDLAVEENNLPMNISLLRKALNDRPGNPLYIGTVSRRGYRFQAKVDKAPPAQDVIDATEFSDTNRESSPLSHDTLGVASANSCHQLRAPVGDFVGREREIAILTAALRTGGVAGITGISGMGGIGKTELAFYVAERLRDTYPDAQLVVDMRGTDNPPRDPADALAACIRAFAGVEQRLPDDLQELIRIYRSTLVGKRALILLDNASDAAQARPLLPPAGSALLVTSRETIALPGLKRVTLEQLSPGEARELLRGIAPRVSTDTADRICYLCGYLPLAIRAAGSLLDVTADLAPETYAEHLEDERRRLEFIGAEGVDLSVEASFGLSYERLTPDTARVFRQLAVFPASFDAQAEEEVCEDAGHKHLSELLRRNLVRYNRETQRYSLHDLARLFANSRLSEEERSASQMRHAAHYLGVLEDCGTLYLQGGYSVNSSLALFDVERRNIEAGQEWTWHHSEADEIAAQMCKEYPGVGTYVLELRQHPRERMRWLEAGLAASQRLNDRAAEGRHLGNLGAAYAALGEMRRAVKFLEQALAIDREIGDRRRESQVLGNLGIAYAAFGDMRCAIELYEQQLLIARDMGDRRGEGYGLGNLGLAYSILGETRKTIQFYEQSLAIAREIGDRRGESNTLTNLGLAYADSGETHTAIEYYEEALSIARELGDRRGEGNTLSNLGSAYADLGETQTAVEYYNQALALRSQIGDRRGEGYDLMRLSIAVDRLGDRAQAIALAKASLKIREEIEDPHADTVRRQLAEWQQS